MFGIATLHLCHPVATYRAPTRLLLANGLLFATDGLDVKHLTDSPRQRLNENDDGFVGHRRELELLDRKLEAARRGAGGIAMLVGEPGIGKTRLAREFATYAASRDSVVLWGRCFEGGWQPPYGPLVEALGRHVRTKRADQQDAIQRASSLSQLLSEIGSPTLDASGELNMGPEEERFRLCDAVSRFVLGLARDEVVLLVLDDLHWADPDSLFLLRHLCRFLGQSQLLLLGTYREHDLQSDHPLDSLILELRRELSYDRIPVRGLTALETRDFLAQSTGHVPPTSIVDAIYAETDGNPFFIRELCRYLVEEGKLLDSDQGWSESVDSFDLRIPEGIRQLVARRLARLGPEANYLLRSVAAFSKDFESRELRLLVELPEEKLLNSLDEALTAGLIVVRGVHRPRYEFAHAIVRHAIYEQLNPDRRARLHRQIAVALEMAYPGHEFERASEIAEQYHSSISIPGASSGIPYALAASKQAKESFAFDRSVRFLRIASSLAVESEPGTQADVLCQLAIAEARALALVEANCTAGAALSALERSGGSSKARAEFLATIAGLLKDAGAVRPLWQSLIDTGLALLGDDHDLVWARLKLLGKAGQRAIGVDRADHRGIQELEAISLLRRSGRQEDYVLTQDMMDARTPEETSAIQDLASRWQENPRAAIHLLVVAVHDLADIHLDYAKGEACCRQVLTLTERIGSISSRAEALIRLSSIQGEQGDLALARGTLSQAEAIVSSLSALHPLRAVALGSEAKLAYYLGADFAALNAQANRLAAVRRDPADPIGLVVRACLALLLAMSGNRDEASITLAGVTPDLDSIEPADWAFWPRTSYHKLTISLCGCAAWHIPAPEFAASYRRLATDLLAYGKGDRHFLPHRLTIARMAALQGDIQEATEQFAHLRADLKGRGSHPIAAIVDFDEALSLNRLGLHADRALALAGSALRGFDRAGLAYWIALATDLKNRLEGNRPDRACDQDYPDGLTGREVQVLRLLAEGKTNKEIAAVLVISVGTVERHVANVYAKTGLDRRAKAVTYALRLGLV